MLTVWQLNLHAEYLSVQFKLGITPNGIAIALVRHLKNVHIERCAVRHFR